ncbi:MAG: M1 family metallopeptidase [Candidatus Edwardsbacteria bacterium]|nr:M1 family metallopeptidase [Candidatus Edwardsbacteria bacterium]
MKRFALFVAALMLAAPAFAWQQRVEYTIDVSLDTVKHSLEATERLRYFNNSPDTLPFVWFHLYPNAYKDRTSLLARDAERFHDYRGRLLRDKDRGFIQVQSLRIQGTDLSLAPGEDSTSVRVGLPAPLMPGDSTNFDIQFTVKLPRIISRLGHDKAHYEISQWYPKIVVYDEKGWHPDGYRYLGEFYGDYGSFQVGIITPTGMKVGATGIEVSDPGDTLSPAADSIAYRLFCADNVHDFVWCADSKYLDTTEIHNGVAIRVLTLPAHKKKWSNVMQYAKDALDYYGKWYGAYPYATLTVCDGSMAAGGGMEYPNLVIISSGEDKYTRTLELVVMHEIGHQWFYGIIGNNEMDEAWLDEGINSFSEERYFEEKYGSKGNIFAKPRLQKLFPEFTDRYFGRMMYYMFAASKMEQPILTRACDVREPNLYAVTAYKKPALMMWWLKGYLGDKTFDAAMQSYYRTYRFKHVTAEQFFRVVDSAAHKNVRPFCLPWLTTTERCDYAISSIKRVKEQPNTYRVTLERNDSLVFPVTLQLEDKINKRYIVNWSGIGADTTFLIQTDAKLSSAALDPENSLPEIDRFNNHSPRKVSFTLLPRLPSLDKYQIFWAPVPWYDGINGFRLGSLIHGGYMADGGPMLGRHQWTFSPYWGFRSKELSFSLDYRTPLTGRPMPPRLYVSLGKAFDTEWASLGLRRNWGEALMSPDERFDVHLAYNRTEDVHRFWDPRDIEEGRNFILTAERGFTFASALLGSNFRIASSVGLITEPKLPINNFIRAEIEEKLRFRLGRCLRPRLRVFAGYIEGPAPAQEQYFLSGGFKTTGFEDMIISYKGWWSAQEHYHVDGGANLPGYLGRHVRGNMAAAANLSLPIHYSPLELFFGAGQVVNDWPEFKRKNLAADAGIRIEFGGLRLILPLWINQPLPDKKRFDWRWKVGFGGTLKIG